MKTAFNLVFDEADSGYECVDICLCVCINSQEILAVCEPTFLQFSSLFELALCIALMSVNCLISVRVSVCS
jgi:hypothetical protein